MGKAISEALSLLVKEWVDELQGIDMAERIIGRVAMPSDKEMAIRTATAQRMLTAVEELAARAERLDRDAESHGHDAKFWSARAVDEEVISSAESLLGLGGMQMGCRLKPGHLAVVGRRSHRGEIFWRARYRGLRRPCQERRDASDRPARLPMIARHVYALA